MPEPHANGQTSPLASASASAATAVPAADDAPSAARRAQVPPPPTTMRAVRLDTAAGRLSVRDDVPVPVPGPGEALVKVAACGICHSDLSQISGHIRPTLPEITPGHEAAGVVSAVGPDVTYWAPGDRVVLAAGRRCGRCPACLQGAGIDDCERLEILSFAYDGAWAEYVLTPAVSLVRVPDAVPLEQAAVLADAVSTPYGAVEATGVRPAQAVGVWGVGGIGTHLVQLLRLCGASPIVAVDPLPSARERALRLGADLAVDPADEDAVRRIVETAGGTGLRYAFDCVGRSATTSQAAATLAPRGRLVMVGLSPDTLDLGRQAVFVARRHEVVGHLGYRIGHLRDLVELVARGRLDVSGSISDVLPLEDAEEGVRRLREHDGDPVRILLRP